MTSTHNVSAGDACAPSAPERGWNAGPTWRGTRRTRGIRGIRGVWGVWAILPLVCAGSAFADTWFVDRSAPSGGNGTAWTVAFDTLQAALAVAQPGDEVRVAQGVYKPAPPGGPRTATFTIPQGVAVRGGFAGRGAPDPDARPTGAITFADGDLLGNDVPNGNRLDNVDHVMSSSGIGSLLERFSVRNGDYSDFSTAGSGLAISGGDLRVVDCAFIGNVGGTGGGLGVTNGSPRIERCTFSANTAFRYGAGVYTTGAGQPLIIDCLFENNVGGLGSGAANVGPGTPRFERCVFRNNLPTIGIGSGAGAVDLESFQGVPGASTFLDCRFEGNRTGAGGGGILMRGSATVMRRCRFVGNVGSFDGGGGVYVDAGSDVLLESCVFTGNTTQAAGSALFVANEAHATAVNCTIANNGGSVSNFRAINVIGHLRLLNTIVWKNRDQLGESQESQIFLQEFPGFPDFTSSLLIQNSLIQGWTGLINALVVPPENAVFGADPAFVDRAGPDLVPGTSDDDFRLANGSPAINAGRNALLPPQFGPDVSGSNRVACRSVDLGAFESLGPACRGDFNCSGGLPTVQDIFDLLLDYFAASPSADFNGSGAISVQDIFDFLAAYFAGC